MKIRFLRRVILGFVGLTIGLVAAEVLSAHFYYPVSDALIHRIPDPVLGWRLEPNAQYTAQTGNVVARVNYSSRGFHDRLHSYEKPHGVYRIVVLGDSYMEGYSVGLPNTFATRLGQYMAQHGKSNVEVINLGVGGYGSLQEYYVFMVEGLKYHPDLVLLGFHLASDLSDNSLELQRRREGLQSFKYTSRPFLLPGPDSEWNVKLVDYPSAKATYDRAVDEVQHAPFWRKSHLVQLFEPLQLRWHPRGNSVNDQWQLEHISPHYCVQTDPYRSAWNISRRILTRINQQAHSAHAQFIVFTVPSIFEADPTRTNKVSFLQPILNQFCMDPPIGYDRLKSILDQEKIRSVDLYRAFHTHERNDELFLIDGHWNKFGQKLAADEVGRNLFSSLEYFQR